MGLPENCGLELHGKWAKGRRNMITDVPGVAVGHATVHEGDIHTGVTAILPHRGDLFREKVTAACSVINGFGKSTGLVQVAELGTVEAPIMMTNTLSVGAVLDETVRCMLERDPDIGVKTGTVNCVVTECNDGALNDIRGLHVTGRHVRQALENCGEDFAEGAVGAGAGMVCLGLKGGIGSASRTVRLDETDYTVGAIVLSNFGRAGDLVIGGRRYDTRLAGAASAKDRGSVIIVLATDIPLGERQLERVAKRSMIALGRVGSFCGNGSGDIALAFTTGNNRPHTSKRLILPVRMLHDDGIDCVFEAAVEAVEEAVISSLYHAETTTGIRGNTYTGLRDFLRTYAPRQEVCGGGGL